jgi:hypothetical protein
MILRIRSSCGVSYQCELSNVLATYMIFKRLCANVKTKFFLTSVHFQMGSKVIFLEKRFCADKTAIRIL